MQTRSEETRAHLLSAAQELFTKNGYAETGVAEICAFAEVSKGAFYHHFPSKQAVFLQLLQDWLSTLEASLNAAAEGAQNVPETLNRMVESIDMVFRVGGGRLPMFLEFWLQASRDSAVWRASIEPYRRFRDFFASLVRQGIREGSLRQVSPELAAQTLMSLAVGLLLQGLLDPQGEDWGQVTRQSVGLFIDRLRQP